MSRQHRNPWACECHRCLAFQDHSPRPDPALYCEGYRAYRQFWEIPDYILETLTEAGLD